MTKIRITKKFQFEMAHLLDGYDGLCRNIHGHSYKLSVTCIGTIRQDNSEKDGMVMDFGILKKIVKAQIVDPLDHALLVKHGTNIADRLQGLSEKIYEVDYQPTCENMVATFAKKIIPNLPPEIQLFSLRLYETSTSYAEWFASDNEC